MREKMCASPAHMSVYVRVHSHKELGHRDYYMPERRLRPISRKVSLAYPLTVPRQKVLRFHARNELRRNEIRLFSLVCNIKHETHNFHTNTHTFVVCGLYIAVPRISRLAVVQHKMVKTGRVCLVLFCPVGKQWPNLGVNLLL